MLQTTNLPSAGKIFSSIQISSLYQEPEPSEKNCRMESSLPVILIGHMSVYCASVSQTAIAGNFLFYESRKVHQKESDRCANTIPAFPERPGDLSCVFVQPTFSPRPEGRGGKEAVFRLTVFCIITFSSLICEAMKRAHINTGFTPRLSRPSFCSLIVRLCVSSTTHPPAGTDAYYERKWKDRLPIGAARLGLALKSEPEFAPLNDVSCVPSSSLLRHQQPPFANFFAGRAAYPAKSKRQ